MMYRGGFYRGGPEVMSAIAGIDQALWDIKGKALGVPVYELLGGACRDRLKVYRWIGGDRPSDIRAGAREAYEQGYRALKMNGTEEMHYIDSFKKVQAVCDRVAAIRDELGFDMDIAVDFHGRVHKTMAKVLARELDQFRLMFIEEPVLSQNNEALREIARATTTPISTGERMFSRWDFKQIFEDGYVDIIQPDLSHAGGISECRKTLRWPRPTTSRWRLTVRSGRSRWGHVSRSIPARLMSLSRNRASVFTTTAAAICSTTSRTPRSTLQRGLPRADARPRPWG